MAESSPSRQRAMRLFSSAALVGHAAALIVVPLLWMIRGQDAGLTALVTAIAALAFLGIGQVVQVLLADAPPRQLFLGTMASYVIRVAIPLVFLLAAQSRPESLAAIDRPSVAITVVTIVLGWLTAEVYTFRRLRIPVFDNGE